MNTLPLSEWRTAYAAALFENECGPWRAKVKEATAKIEERVLALSRNDAIERISIEVARKGLATMECGPISRNLSKSNSVTVAATNPAQNNCYPEVGSHVRVALRGSEVVEAEVFAIFSAATRKPVLVSFEKHFARIDLRQILE